MQSNFKKRMIILSVVLMLSLGGCAKERTVYVSGGTQQSEQPETKEAAPDASDGAFQEQDETDMGYVYVCGAVKAPGVYGVFEGMRVFEAVEAAGGFTEAADTMWLNQAEQVSDGQRLYVYTQEETMQLQSAQESSEPVFFQETQRDTEASGTKVNLNTAGREALMTLPGIGEVKADLIISYREENGAFSSIEEIQNIPGIKNAVFLKIKDQITV